MTTLDWLAQNQALICAMLALAISELLPFVKSTQWNGILQGVRDALKARAAMKAAAKKAALLLPVAFLAALPGCTFCRDAAHASAPSCVLQANMVKCGEQAGFALIPVVLGLIAGALAQQPFDAQALEAQLISLGVKDVPCVLAALEDYIAGSAEAKAGDPASLMLAEELHAALVASLSKRGMRGRMRLQLRAGHAVDVDVP